MREALRAVRSNKRRCPSCILTRTGRWTCKYWCVWFILHSSFKLESVRDLRKSRTGIKPPGWSQHEISERNPLSWSAFRTISAPYLFLHTESARGRYVWLATKKGTNSFCIWIFYRQAEVEVFLTFAILYSFRLLFSPLAGENHPNAAFFSSFNVDTKFSRDPRRCWFLIRIFVFQPPPPPEKKFKWVVGAGAGNYVKAVDSSQPNSAAQVTNNPKPPSVYSSYFFAGSSIASNQSSPGSICKVSRRQVKFSLT